MDQPSADQIRRTWLKKTSATVLATGIGATLVLSGLVWAQDRAVTASVPEQSAVVPQQSFAPLVKKILPAVVNISVTEKSGVEGSADRPPEPFNGSPLDDFLRRFFDQHKGDGQSVPRSFRGGPGVESGPKAIALGSGFIIDPSGYIVTNNHVVGEAARVEVTLQDNSKHAARIVG